MSYRPLAGKTMAETTKRLQGAMEKAQGNQTTALVQIAFEATIMDHYRDVHPDPAELLSQFPAKREEWTPFHEATFNFLTKLGQWKTDLEQDKTGK